MRKPTPKPHLFREYREERRARHLRSVAQVLAMMERR